MKTEPTTSLLMLFFAMQCGPAGGSELSSDRGFVNVRQRYGAKGDGVTDDTEAMQRAINENTGRHRLLYFPRGTYLVSATLKWPKKFGGQDNWGFTYLSGESPETSVIRLKDATLCKPPARCLPTRPRAFPARGLEAKRPRVTHCGTQLVWVTR